MPHPCPISRRRNVLRNIVIVAGFVLWLATACAGRSPVQPLPLADRSASPSSPLPTEMDEPTRAVSAPALRHYLRARMLTLDGDWQGATDAMRLAISHDYESAFLHVELARLLRVQQRLDAALRELALATKLDPGYARAYYHMGEIAVARHDFDHAADCFFMALSLDPHHVESIRALAGVLFITEGVEATVGFLEERLQADPALSEVRATLVRLHLINGDTQPMTARIIEGIRLDPDTVRFVDDVVDWSLRTGRFASGLQVVDALLDAVGELPILRLRQADLHFASGDTAAAATAIAAARRLETFDDDAAVRLGLVYLRHRQHAQAEGVFAELVAAGASMLSVYLLGYVQMQAKNCDAALEQFARLSRSDGLTYASARTDSARCLRKRGDEREADRLVEELTALAEGDPEVLRLVADYYRETGREREALRVLAGEFSRHPASGDLAYLTAVYALRAGESAQAAAILTRLAALEAYNPDVLNLLAYCLALRGERLAEAERLARQAMALRPGDGAIIDTLGYVHYRQGHLKPALRWLSLAALLLPNEPEVLLHLALVYRDMGDKARLRDVLRRAVELTADDPPGRKPFETSFPTLWPRLKQEARSQEGDAP